MIINFKISKEAEEQLKRDYSILEEKTGKSKDFHIKEALVRYLEDLEDENELERLKEEGEFGTI
jgi:predicted DNA-binding protein